MRPERAALRLGLQIVSAKLAEMMGAPGLNAIASPPPRPVQTAPLLGPPAEDAATELDAELPTTNAQVRDRSAKIAPGRIVTP